MTLQLDLTGSNKWRRIYYQQFLGNSDNWKRYRIPCISPFELPFLFESHVLAVSSSYFEARPTWRCAGYLTSVYSGLNLAETDVSSTTGSPTAALDAQRRRITLNATQLVMFPPIASNYYLWFDPVPWLPKLALGVWEYTGVVHDTTEELIETLKVDVVRVESKIDALNY